jgi:hypothetical protein
VTEGVDPSAKAPNAPLDRPENLLKQLAFHRQKSVHVGRAGRPLIHWSLPMRCYLIRDHQVTVCTDIPKAVAADTLLIRAPRDLDQNRFPAARLVDLWNGLPGAEPIKRFKDRPTAIKRFWAAIEALPVSTARSNSKQARLIALLQRPQGASVEELMESTGWQQHSVRGALSGVLRKKLGLNVVSVKDGNGRVYRIAA